MTEPTIRAVRDSIRAQLRTLPLAVDHNGISAEEYAARAEASARLEAVATPELAPAPQVGMKPNPAQGHAGAPAPAQQSHNGSTLERVRAQIHSAGEALFDDGTGAA